jgi:hypothetical protein
MFVYHDAGFTAWDLADHYGPAEDFLGVFRRDFAARHGVERLSEIQAFARLSGVYSSIMVSIRTVLPSVGRSGLDPVWMTVLGRKEAGGSQCQEPIHRTRWSIGGESSSWPRRALD